MARSFTQHIKAVFVDANGVTYEALLPITDVTGLTEALAAISSDELAVLDAVTAGTVTASKALVADANRDLASLRNLTTTNLAAQTAAMAVTGLAAAQGGAISVTGGTSSTSANAGGAITVVGGAPGATGVGGAVSATGGAAVSGAGGQASVVGGAGGTGGAGGAAVFTGGGGAGAGLGGAFTATGGLGGATNAVGGAASVTGGAGNGTGNGAVGSVVGGASGGGATGNGGLAKIVGGAAASTAGTGGAVQVTGGLGTTTGAGGAVTITSGAAGSSGVAGTVDIAVGGATAGNGSAITVTGGNGAGGTASGGNVNLKGGTAVSTGQPGEVQVNGDSNLVFATYFFTGTPAATDQAFFVAPRALRVKTIKQVHSVAAGGASTLTVIKDTGTSAPGAGTSLHQSGSFDLNGTANTVQSGTVSTTIATANLAAGDRLSVKFANAIQASVGILVTVGMVPI